MSNSQYYLRRSWLAGNYHCSNGMCSLQSLLSAQYVSESSSFQCLPRRRRFHKKKNEKIRKIQNPEKMKFTAALHY
jgi:hypothetical protein